MTDQHPRCEDLWINLLPPLRDRHVVRLGADRTEAIYNLRARFPRSLAVIGCADSEVKNLASTYEDVAAVPTEACDVFIADEANVVDASILQYGASVFVAHVSRLMRSNGSLVMAIPDVAVNTFWRRYALLCCLRKQFGNRLSRYVCEPSSRDVEALETLAGAIRNVWREARGIRERRGCYVFASKARTLARSVRDGLLVMVRPDEDVEKCSMSIVDELIIQSGLASSGNTTSASFDIAYQHCGSRHLMFIRDRASSELLYVGKLDLANSTIYGRAVSEYRNLQLVGLCKEDLARHKVRVPAVCFRRASSYRHEMIVSALEGTSLELLVTESVRDKKGRRVQEIAESVVLLQRDLHNCLTDRIAKSVSRVPHVYFQDYLRLGLEWTYGDAQVFSECVQHGDFSVNNMLYDSASQYWGILDWEAMACGYPVLFDWFSFVTSLRLTCNGRPCRHNTKDYYDSFVLTYFREHEYTEHLRTLTVQCCRYFSIDRTSMQKCFTAFLLYKCNRCRLLDFPVFRALWENALTYAVEHADLFTLAR